MADRFRLGSLLKELRQLYRRLTALILRQRMEGVRPDAQGQSHQVRPSAERRIDRLSSANQQPMPPAAESGAADLEPAGAEPASPPSARKEGVIGQLIKGLQNLLKGKKRSPTLQPHLAEQMRESTWDHLHSAERCARLGEREKARLHLEIAMSALDESAHYMPEEEYREFHRRVAAELAEHDELPKA